MPGFSTPFRDHYEHSRTLDCAGQIEECTDYVQHPDVLLTEFLESYYLVERQSEPLPEEDPDGKDEDECVLEPFQDSLQLEILSDAGPPERILCAGGAFDPLPSGEHPAVHHRGLDYVGMRESSSRIVLGVTEAEQEETTYLLLLRVLNCFAEVAPPFQLARLRRLVVRERIRSDATFDLQIGLSNRLEFAAETALGQLTRDLAEAFKRRILRQPQFAGTLGWIDCLHLDAEAKGLHTSLRLDWRV
ncbi:MAG: hypothetical protein JSU66_03185 [Deltaproteobacteria bacterium]|nr:MAG: hypothetical protein JSU66_03185 [Deltaproteobacteria bacterium]